MLQLLGREVMQGPVATRRSPQYGELWAGNQCQTPSGWEPGQLSGAACCSEGCLLSLCSSTTCMSASNGFSASSSGGRR